MVSHVMVACDCFKISCTYLESEDHDEEAPGYGEDHVEEEVPVVAVADAAVEPGAVVVHLGRHTLMTSTSFL